MRKASLQRKLLVFSLMVLKGQLLLPSVDFVEGGKPEYPEKNPRSQIEIDKSQPTCGAQESNPGRRGGRRK